MINILNRTSTSDDAKSSDFKIMRHWDPIFFVDQLEVLADYGVKTLRLSDEMFFLNKKYYVPILQEIIKRGLKFNMWAYARIDTIREDQLELFKKAGINWLCPGIEAGNQVVRTNIEKGKFKETNIREVIEMVNSFDINILGNYIFGLPEDKTPNETFELALELNTEHAKFYQHKHCLVHHFILKLKKKTGKCQKVMKSTLFFLMSVNHYKQIIVLQLKF